MNKHSTSGLIDPLLCGFQMEMSDNEETPLDPTRIFGTPYRLVAMAIRKFDQSIDLELDTPMQVKSYVRYCISHELAQKGSYTWISENKPITSISTVHTMDGLFRWVFGKLMGRTQHINTITPLTEDKAESLRYGNCNSIVIGENSHTAFYAMFAALGSRYNYRCPIFITNSKHSSIKKVIATNAIFRELSILSNIITEGRWETERSQQFERCGLNTKGMVETFLLFFTRDVASSKFITKENYPKNPEEMYKTVVTLIRNYIMPMLDNAGFLEDHDKNSILANMPEALARNRNIGNIFLIGIYIILRANDLPTGNYKDTASYIDDIFIKAVENAEDVKPDTKMIVGRAVRNNWHSVGHVIERLFESSHESVILYLHKLRGGCTTNDSAPHVDPFIDAKVSIMDATGLDHTQDACADLTGKDRADIENVTSENPVDVLSETPPKTSIFFKSTMIKDKRVSEDLPRLIGNLRKKYLNAESGTMETVTLDNSDIANKKAVEDLLQKVFNFKKVDINLSDESVNASTAVLTVFVANDFFTESEIAKGVVEVSTKGIKFTKDKVTAYVNLNRGLLINSLLTDRQISAIVLHEIGHQFEEYSNIDDYTATKYRHQLAGKLALIHSSITLIPSFMVYVLPEIQFGDLPMAIAMLGGITSAYMKMLAVAVYTHGDKGVPRKVIEGYLKETRAEYEKGAKRIHGDEDNPSYKVYMKVFRAIENAIEIFFAVETGLHLFRGFKTFLLNDSVVRYIHPAYVNELYNHRFNGKLSHKKEYTADSMATAYGYATDLHMALAIASGQRYDKHSVTNRVVRKMPVLNIIAASYRIINKQFHILIQGGTSHPSVMKRIDASISQLKGLASGPGADVATKAKIKRDIEELEETKKIVRHSSELAAIVNTNGPDKAKKIRQHFAEEAVPAGLLDMYTGTKTDKSIETPKSVARKMLNIAAKHSLGPDSEVAKGELKDVDNSLFSLPEFVKFNSMLKDNNLKLNKEQVIKNI